MSFLSSLLFASAVMGAESAAPWPETVAASVVAASSHDGQLDALRGCVTSAPDREARQRVMFAARVLGRCPRTAGTIPRCSTPT